MKCKNETCGKEGCFNCENCKAHQTYAPDGVSGGITEKEAVSIGWMPVSGGGWMCPNCSGNGDKLDSIFNSQ